MTRLHGDMAIYIDVRTFSLCSEEVTGCGGVLALLELDECVMMNNNFGETRL
jgi:hypothetical protein